MRLLVTGSGRSGTTWTAAALRAAGVDCSHERVFTSRGMSADDWLAESSAGAAPFTPMDDTYVVRLVRHPLKVIASAVHRGGVLSRSDFAARYVPELRGISDLAEQAAVYWVRWNDLVVADETLRLEDATKYEIIRIAAAAGYDTRSDFVLPPRLNASKGRLKPVAWEQVEHVPGLVSKAEQWGYL